MDHHFGNHIIFNDEDHSHLDVYINKKYCRIWFLENYEKLMDPPPFGLIVSLGYFMNETGTVVTVNGGIETYYRTSFGTSWKIWIPMKCVSWCHISHSLGRNDFTFKEVAGASRRSKIN